MWVGEFSNQMEEGEEKELWMDSRTTLEEPRVSHPNNHALLLQARTKELANHVGRRLGPMVTEHALVALGPERDRPSLGRQQDQSGVFGERLALESRHSDLGPLH